MGFSAKDAPLAAAILADLREQFLEVSVTYLREGTVEHGTPSSDEGYVQIHVEPQREGKR